MRELPKRPKPAQAARQGATPEMKWNELEREILAAGWVRMDEGKGSSHIRFERKGNSAGITFQPSYGGGLLKDLAVRFGIEHVLGSDKRRVARAQATRTTHRRSRKPLTPEKTPDLSRPRGAVQQINAAAAGDPPFFAQVVPLRAAGSIALLEQPADQSCPRCAGTGVVTCPRCLAETKDIVVTILQACLQEIGQLRAELRERDQRLAIAATGVVDERKRKMYDKLAVLIQEAE